MATETSASDVLKPDFGARRKHFIFTDEHEQLRESIRGFVTREFAPHSAEWEETTLLGEEMVHAQSGGLAMGIAVHTDMAMPPILAFGTEEQKQEWVVPAIKGEKILCLGITEPDAGSDVAGIKTRATYDEATDEYVINGSKTY